MSSNKESGSCGRIDNNDHALENDAADQPISITPPSIVLSSSAGVEAASFPIHKEQEVESNSNAINRSLSTRSRKSDCSTTAHADTTTIIHPLQQMMVHSSTIQSPLSRESPQEAHIRSTLAYVVPQIARTNEAIQYSTLLTSSMPQPRSDLPRIFAVSSYNDCANSKKISKQEIGDSLVTRKTLSSGSSHLHKFHRLATSRRSCDDLNDDASIADHTSEIDPIGVASTTLPPVFQSIECLPSIDHTKTTHSALVIGEQSIVTSASMATEAVINSSTASRQQRARASTPNRHNSSLFSAEDITIGDDMLHETLMATSNAFGEIVCIEGNVDDSRLSGRWCEKCGSEQTHENERYGPFGLLSRTKPRTIEGRVYRGFCLNCHDVQDLRQLLNDPHIPLGLVRRDPHTSAAVHLLQRNSGNTIVLPSSKRKQSHIAVLCDSVLCQIICAVMVVVIVGVSITVGVVVVSEKPQPWEPPSSSPSIAPTPPFFRSSAPVGLDVTRTGAISRDAESFGYNIELSQDGNILAVASPKYKGMRGRVDVFTLSKGVNDTTSTSDSADDSIGESIGEPIIGDLIGDQLGISMDLSGDGRVVVVGSPGNNAGLVRAYSIDPNMGLSQKGQTIIGPAPLCQFGYSTSLNFEGSRLFVGAPRYAENPNEMYGLVQAYDFNGTAWLKVGSDMVGKSDGGRFGHSISTDDSGNRVSVGAPSATIHWQEEGEIYIYYFDAADWVQLNSRNIATIKGDPKGRQLGRRVVMNRSGNYTMSGQYRSDESLIAGIVKTWKIDGPSDDVFEVLDRDLPYWLTSHFPSVRRFGYDFNFALKFIDANETLEMSLITIASSGNLDGESGVAILSQIDDSHGNSIVGAAGLRLGDTKWLGQGPSVAIARERCRFAIGYESLWINYTYSRPEVRIFDVAASWCP